MLFAVLFLVLAVGIFPHSNRVMNKTNWIMEKIDLLIFRVEMWYQNLPDDTQKFPPLSPEEQEDLDRFLADPGPFPDGNCYYTNKWGIRTFGIPPTNEQPREGSDI